MQVMQNQNALSIDKECRNHLVNAFRQNKWNVAQETKLPRPSPWPRAWYGQQAAMQNPSFPGSPVLSPKDKSCQWLPIGTSNQRKPTGKGLGTWPRPLRGGPGACHGVWGIGRYYASYCNTYPTRHQEPGIHLLIQGLSIAPDSCPFLRASCM
jgi:hypothetical protein